LMIPINGRDHMREARGIVGNMNETEAAWLCAQVGPSYVIPMHYECITGNTGNPGHFTTLIREAETPATVLAPPPATPLPAPPPPRPPPTPPPGAGGGPRRPSAPAAPGPPRSASPRAVRPWPPPRRNAWAGSSSPPLAASPTAWAASATWSPDKPTPLGSLS